MELVMTKATKLGPMCPSVASHAPSPGTTPPADVAGHDAEFECFIRNLVRRRLARASPVAPDGARPRPYGVMEPPEDPPRIALACPSAPDSWDGSGEHPPLPRFAHLL